MSPSRRPRRTVVAARPRVSGGRVVALGVAVVAATAFIGWRLVDLQLTPDPALAHDVGSQVREEVIPAPRGEIHDRWGRIFAVSLPRPSIVANPALLQAHDVAHPEDRVLERAVDDLAAVLSTSRETIETRLRSDRSFAYLERQVDPEVGEAVRALEIPGVYLDEEQRREHPFGDCSGIAVIGKVDVDQQGVSGLEQTFDGLLQGEPGMQVRQTQVGGDVQIPGGFRVVDAMVPGADLRLALDRNVQYESEQQLVDVLERAEGDRAVAIVSDPNTGEILAMANAVRDPDTGEASCTTTNLAVTWSYEPGSIMKPITFASVFEHDAWPEQYPIDIPHQITIDLGPDVKPHVYTDEYVDAAVESHTPTWILRESSNNGTILLAREAGADALHDTMTAFGFGSATALGLNGEASGILDRLDSHALKLSNAAIGQGVAVTPLQMLLAYNTLATDGHRVAPTLLADEAGSAAPVEVVAPDTARSIMQMMRQVVIDGTGTEAAIPGYVVAGKTGTAWQPCEVEGSSGYECGGGGRHYTASFAGIVENDAGAALSAIVVVDNPRRGEVYGGSLAAPVFADIVEYALRQLRVAPSSHGPPAAVGVRAMAAQAPPPDQPAS